LNKRLIYIFAITAVIVTVLFGGFGVSRVLATDACPNGNGWVKVDSNDLSSYPVEGATEYCFKYGSANSQGCTGGTSSSWPPPGVSNPCGLSHWSYFIPKATYTPTNTATNTPTNTPTDTPTNTATNTPTNTPVDDTATPTDTATATNTPGECIEGQCPTDTPTSTPVDPCIENPGQCASVTPTDPGVTPTLTATPPGERARNCKEMLAAYETRNDDGTWPYDINNPPAELLKYREQCGPASAGNVVVYGILGLAGLMGLAGTGFWLYKRSVQ
jgi:hypothetical protein